jgi:hypothetical protein
MPKHCIQVINGHPVFQYDPNVFRVLRRDTGELLGPFSEAQAVRVAMELRPRLNGAPLPPSFRCLHCFDRGYHCPVCQPD